MNASQLRRRAVLLPMVAALLLGGAAYLARDLIAVQQRGARAIGQVVGFEARELPGGTGRRIVYHPVVEFQLPAGETIRFVDSSGAARPSFRQGETVRVLYDRQNPERAILDRGFANWLVPGVPFALGLLLLAIALHAIVKISRRAGEDADPFRRAVEPR